MKIALIGATGNVGSRLLDEALRRNHQVTAIARKASSLTPRAGLVAHDLDLHDGTALAALLQGHDAVISSARFTGIPAVTIVTPVKQAGVKRLLVVGVAGSLEVAPGMALIDTPQFPAEYKAEAGAGRDFLLELRKEQTLDWTFLSPSALFVPGERTGVFRLGQDQLLSSADGKSWISMEDFAIALFDELEQPRHVRSRFTVGY